MEDSYRKALMVDGQACMLEILDTAGQEEYTTLRGQWMLDGEAFLLVYSTTSRSSFTRVSKFHSQLMSVKSSPESQLSSAAPQGRPIYLLVGNKCDISTEREISTQEGEALARDLGCEFVETSAKNRINVERAFYDLVRLLRTQRLYPGAGSTFLRNTPYTITRCWWRKSISINPDERTCAEGRRRLTNSLIDAAKANHKRELLAFLKAGANVNGQSGSDGAAIHAAAASGHLRIVKILLKRGAFINAREATGISPLQVAAAEGHLAVVRLLLRRGAQIDQASQLYGTALSAAASRGRAAVVSLLVKKGANVSLMGGGTYRNFLQASVWTEKEEISGNKRMELQVMTPTAITDTSAVDFPRLSISLPDITIQLDPLSAEAIANKPGDIPSLPD